MIQAIKELGEIILQQGKKNSANLLSCVVHNPNKDGKYPKVLIAVFEQVFHDAAISLNYKEIRIEDFSKNKILKYLYRRGASQGADFTLTSKITEVDKFFKNKIMSWINKYESIGDYFVKSLCEAIKKSEHSMKKDLRNKYYEIKLQPQAKEGCLFTVGFINSGDIRYIGDFKIFQDILIEQVKKDYKQIVRKNHVCSVCGTKKEEVYGNAINKVFKFYTLDKPGYIAGGFNYLNAWKNAPVCLECTLTLEEGKKYMDENLKFSIGGQQYYLIPKFIMGITGKENIVKTFFEFPSNMKDKKLNLKSLKKRSDDEEDILDALGKYKDSLTFNFLFFAATNPQVFKITCFIEDVLPSRIKNILEVIEGVKQIEIFKNVKIGRQYIDIAFTFGKLRKFVPSVKNFLEIMDMIFKGVKFDSEILFSWFMTKIREELLKQTNWKKPMVLEAYATFLFLKKLGILFEKSYIQKGDEIMNELKAKIEEFFNKFPDTFYSPPHKAIFLLGVLVQKLLDIQFSERGAAPFRKHLKNFKMREADFKGLLSKTQNKLEEYKKNYYRDIESLISSYFIESGKNWKINTDELNFYFVLGMNLTSEVSNYLKIKEEEQNG